MTAFSSNGCYCNYSNCICGQYTLLKCTYPSCRCKNKLLAISNENNHQLCYLAIKTEERKNNAENDNYRNRQYLLKCNYPSCRCENKLFAISIESDHLLCYLAINTEERKR